MALEFNFMVTDPTTQENYTFSLTNETETSCPHALKALSEGDESAALSWACANCDWDNYHGPPHLV
jgi:hypothetical protein